jgi:ParB/RepB/Spo0J family partition protein
VRGPLKVSQRIDTGRIKVEPGTAQFGAPSGNYVEGSRPLQVLLDRIDDSPYQPRLTYDQEAMAELAASMAAAGQNEPVKLRTKSDGRYELIGGHRRTRAARMLGWTRIDAYIKNLDDAEAQRTTMLDNEARLDLTDYERAKLYQHAMDMGIATTQAKVADYFGTSQAKVSRCMALLALPAQAIEQLEQNAGAISALQAVEMLKQEKPKAAKKAPERKAGSVVTNAAGAPLFTTRLTGREFTVRLNDPTIDAEKVRTAITAALKSLAQTE